MALVWTHAVGQPPVDRGEWVKTATYVRGECAPSTRKEGAASAGARLTLLEVGEPGGIGLTEHMEGGA